MRRAAALAAALLLAVAAPSTTAAAQSAPAAAPDAPKPVFAVALGGGVALGYAHLGVLEVLEEEGLRPDLVTGTSMGSIVGGLWCAGMPADSIAGLAEDLNIFKLMDWKLGGLGFFEWKKVRKRLDPRVGSMRVEDCAVRMVCVATDLFSGERVLLDHGPLVDAMLASGTIPGLYRPVEWEGRLLIDGGLVDEVPVHSAIDAGADVIVAVDVSHPLLGKEMNGPFDVIRQSYFIIQMHNVDGRRKLADVMIRPDLDGLDFHDFGEVDAARQRGREATRLALPEIRAALAAWKPRVERAETRAEDGR